MNIKTKKIIAREFLLLVIVLFLGLLTYFTTFAYNISYKRKMDKVDLQITLKTDSINYLKQPLSTKRQNRAWYFYDIYLTYDYNQDQVWKRLIKLESSDSLSYHWHNKWPKDLIDKHKKSGFKNPSDLSKFIRACMISQSNIDNYNHSIRLENEIFVLNLERNGYNEKRLYRSEQLQVAFNYTLIFAFVLFVFRYIFYALKWSIRTLKQQS